MALKLGAIADDKPVKLAVELPANVHRDLAVYADLLARETGQSIPHPADWSRRCWRGSWRPIELLRKCAARVSRAGQGIAFAQQFEKICERRVIVILAPVR